MVYSLPSAVVSFTFMLTGIYLVKFSAEVLDLAPALMGVLFGMSRLWDAVSDPVAGSLSDRTRSARGRRRSWIVASALPVSVGFAMMWSPPGALGGGALVVWMAAAVFLYFTATTVFSVPHESLAAELSTGHHERTRIFGVRTAVSQLGSFAALGALQLLIASDDPRATGTAIAVGVAAAMCAATFFAVRSVGERPDYQHRGGTGLAAAFRDVSSNPHAVRLFSVFFIENFGTGSLMLLIPFVLDYVFHAEELTVHFMLLYFVSALLFIPVWVGLSRRVGKKGLWLFSMATMAAGFCGLFVVDESRLWLLYLLAFVVGVGGGCGNVVGSSVQADVVDVDEFRTGERKEGAYFAVWNFVRKAGFGAATVLTGLLLGMVGFEANREQAPETLLAMRVLFSFVPGACFAVGTFLFLGFRLDEAEHAAVRRALDGCTGPSQLAR